ncbi:MAG: phage major capsid protein [Rhodanobacteraceae bacterium]|nr:phage major capsid protein [Rhodanobacteraceae bacterium]
MCKINLDFTVRGMRNAAAADPDSIRERLIATADRATAIAAAAEREGRTLTVDERASVDELHSEFLGLRAELDAIDRVQGMQRALAEPMPRGALPPDVVAAANAEAASGRATVSDRRRGIVLPVNCARASSILLPRSADAFGQNVEAFFQSVARGVADPRMLNLTGTESSGADGGFAVPNFWFAGILDQAMQAAEFAPRCLLFPTSTNGITIPMPDTQNRSTDIAGFPPIGPVKTNSKPRNA